jgi:flagellar motor switch/type III secretory pathway protein FliN
MDDVFSVKGTLSVSIGEGYLSSFEASTLKRGDVIRTNKLAGNPATILVNMIPLFPCEVVIMDDLFGVRVTEPRWKEPAVPAPKTRDDLVEILPTHLILGSIRASLAELQAAGPGTIINLAAPFSAEEDVELLAAGMPVARGKVVVLGEEMGMRVTTARPTRFTVKNVRASGYVLEADASDAPVKDYDFKRPDKFSKAQIDTMRNIHALFFRTLRTRLPGLASALADQRQPPVVDQMTYGELMDDLAAAGGYRSIVLENAPPHGALAPAGAAAEAARETAALFEEAGTAHPVDPEGRRFIERLHAEQGFPTRMPIFFSYADGKELNALFDGADGRDALLSCLRGGWKNLVDMRLAAVPVDDPRAQAGAISRNEMVIAVWVAGRDREKGIVVFYPYLTLEPYLGILG